MNNWAAKGGNNRVKVTYRGYDREDVHQRAFFFSSAWKPFALLKFIASDG